MIKSLHVHQFALFERVELELDAGMTVFTGETGAGKSILVDALGAVFGARANSDWVRHGSDRAEVIAEIESEDSRLMQLLHDQEIDPEEGITIRRVITPEGRSKAWINGIPTSAGILKQIGDICFDLHGQHEHQTLLQADFQKHVIDMRVDTELKQKCAQTYQALRQVQKQLHDLQHQRSDTMQKEAWMREESERLRALQLEENLETTLESECEASRHIEQIQQTAAFAIGLVDENDLNIRSLISKISHQVDSYAEHHPALQEVSELLSQMETIASEITPHLQEVLEIQADSESLLLAEDRLAELRAAKRRHQTDESGLISLLASWDDALSTLDTASWDEEALGEKEQQCLLEYRNTAESMHLARQKAASELIANLRPFLDQLGLQNMQLEALIQDHSDPQHWRADGWDSIELRAASNPGEPFKGLSDTASGGELSRLVLSLKGCGALENAPDTAIFDEVDVGIGGETAWCVGELLRNMGKERQVLVVSHLPQVASCAHHQVAIEKSVFDNRTRTQLTMLDATSRTNEIARMLGGINEESLHHAKQMLSRGQEDH